MDYASPSTLYERLGALLNQPLAIERPYLTQHLTTLDAILYTLAETKAKTKKALYEQRERLRMPKDRELTEFDRTTMLNSAVAGMEADYEFMCDLSTIVYNRIELGKFLLSMPEESSS